ncbi:MAG: arylsulfatase regulator (Fe-S oxidoreductase) [Parcubacteria group bacterium GW2011_GWB1_43_6]|nr:MAG: arylsulfatase regulator (Fe-S oxidoreductase) [Parcubacteria group bacterium GW2011_GWB1_43_6]
MQIDTRLILAKSQFVQTVLDGNTAVAWHSLFGNPRTVPIETLEFLDEFREPKALCDVLDEETIDSQREVIQELLTARFLIPKEFDERTFLGEKIKERQGNTANGSLIDYLELIMSEACNFRCTYCIHFNNLETSDRINNPKKFMQLEVARETVDKYLSILQQHGKTMAAINFGGGEPLLAWPVIERILEYCVSHYGREFTFRFSINTNASFITLEIAKKLKQYRVEIASSLDGLHEGNNKVRLTKTGGGTFEKILRGFENLEAAGYPLEGIAVTVNERNFPFLDETIIDWATKRGMSEVRIDIDVIDIIAIQINDVVEKLMRIRRYARERRIDVSGFWSRPAENLNDSTLDVHVSFCGAVRGNNMCVSPSGSIYGCGYSTTELGKLSEIETFHSPDGRYSHFVNGHMTGEVEMCKGCMIESQCGGGCNITQEFARATKTVKIERMCDFYRQMTRELLLEQLREMDPEVESKEILIERR